MALCSCHACCRPTDADAPQWFLCATTGPSDTGENPADLALSATITPNTAPTTSIGTTGNFTNQDINGLLSGQAWTFNAITFSFPTAASQYGSSYFDPAPQNGFQALSASQQDAARYAFRLVSEYAALTFTEVTANPGSAVIRLAGSAHPTTSYAYLPGPFSVSGDVWFGNIRNDPTLMGGYAFSTYLHEIGHALGLKHGHEPSGAYGVLPAERNSTEWSVMTYMSYIGASGAFYENAEGSGNQTYMINDIAALQYMYGANFGTRAGNTTYSWSPTTGEMFIDGVGQGASTANIAYAAIWDGNGTDTYDFSNFTTNLSVDLRPGEWTIFDTVGLAQIAHLGAGNRAEGNVANAHLFMNSDTRSLIEIAIGGAGHDILRGNAGNNTLIGGPGIDTALFSGTSSNYTVTHLGGTSWRFVGPDGNDVLTDIEFVRFDDDGEDIPIAAACFAPGTRIATPQGPRPVEALAIGDLVATAAGPARPVRWIGRRHYSARTVAANPQLLPVRIRAGALAPGLPSRDLMLSPQHAVLVQGGPATGDLLVPVAALVNGTSIRQETAAGAVTYLHVELDRHALLLAEDVPVESFADEDSRALFDNAAEFRRLYPDAKPTPATMPRSESGFAVERARLHLAARAGLAAPRDPAGRLVGHVERIAGGFLEGWAMDEAAPDLAVELLVETPLGHRRALANAWRGDLRRAGIGTARHGFRIPVGPQARTPTVRRARDGAELGWLAG